MTNPVRMTRQDTSEKPRRHGEVQVRAPSGDVIPFNYLEQLEQLDDAVFSALNGDASALEESARLYPEVAGSTPSDLIDESRRQYIRQAEQIVQDYRIAPNEDLGKTFAALEILFLVADS